MTTKINSTSDVSISTSGRDNAVNVATGGDVTIKEAFRLSNSKSVRWRNTADDADLGLTVTASDDLAFNGLTLVSDSLGLIPLASIENGGGGGGSGFTLAVVTTGFTAATNTHYLADTSSAGFTATLPTGAAQAAIRFSDDQRTWGVNYLTIQPASGQRIDGFAIDEALICDLTGATVQVSWDGSKWVVDSNVVLGSSGGSGSFNSITTSEKSYVTRPDNANADWTTSNVSLVTVATEVVSANLPESASKTTAIRITRVSGTTGYVRYRFVADPGDLSKKFKIQWYQKYAGAAGDYTIEMWSFTASDYTTGALQHPVQTSSIPALTNGTFTTSFDTGASTQKYLEIRVVAVAGTTPLYISGVLIGPGVIITGSVVSEWQSYTPTVGGTTTNGTVAYGTREANYRRVGSSVEVELTIVMGTVSVAPTGFLTVSLPQSLTAINPIAGAPHLGTGVFIDDSLGAYHPFRCEVSAGKVYIVANSSTPIPTLAVNDQIKCSFTVPVNEWAGSGTVVIGPGAQVEYAYNTNTADSDDTSSFAFGPSGVSFGSYSTATRSKRVRFSSPIQQDDIVQLEIFRSVAWVPVETSEFVSFSATTGLAIKPVIGSNTDVDVLFGSAGYPATLGGSSSTWSSIAGSPGFKWRVRKSKAQAPAGLSGATTNSLGLVTLSQLFPTNSILNFGAESDTSGWDTYSDAPGTAPVDGTGGTPNLITITRNFASPLRGSADYAVIKSGGVNRQGSGVSYNFTIAAVDRGKKLRLSFDYNTSNVNYTAGDMVVYVYDVSNSTLVTPASVSIPKGTSTFTTSFDTTTGTAYRLIIHQSSTTTADYTLYFDNFYVGTDVVATGAAVSDWQEYTSPTTNGFGTVSSTLRYRRVGSQMELQGNLSLGTLPSSTQARLNLPLNLTVVTISGSTIINVGTWITNAVAGSSIKSGVLIASNGNQFLQFSVGDYTSAINPTVPQNSDAFTLSNRILYIEATIPIAEWAGNGTVNLSSGAQIEYAATSGTWDADSSTTVYGPAGQPIEGTLNAGRNKTITWQYPLQSGDSIEVEFSADRQIWVPLNMATVVGAGTIIPGLNGTATEFSGVTWRHLSATQTRITFGRYLQIPNDDAPTADWPASNAYWRVRKANPSAAVGFGMAGTDGSAGLVAPYNTGNGVVYGGRYTPTATTGTNVSALTAYSCTYTRVGSIVTVHGQCDVTCTTAANTESFFYLSLPIPSNLATSRDLNGVFTRFAPSGTQYTAGIVFADTANDRAQIIFSCNQTAISGTGFTFQYQIL